MRRFGVLSFKIVQIGIAERMTQRTTHGSDLAFVMKGMSQHVMKNQSRSADGDVPIREMKFSIRVELLIRQVRQIRVSPLSDFLLKDSRIGDHRTLFRPPVDVS